MADNFTHCIPKPKDCAFKMCMAWFLGGGQVWKCHNTAQSHIAIASPLLWSLVICDIFKVTSLKLGILVDCKAVNLSDTVERMFLVIFTTRSYLSFINVWRPRPHTPKLIHFSFSMICFNERETEKTQTTNCSTIHNWWNIIYCTGKYLMQCD